MDEKLKQKRLEEFMEELKTVFDEYIESSGLRLSDLIRSADLFIDTLKKENESNNKKNN